MLTEREAPLARIWRDGSELFVGVFPCRCSLPRQAAATGEQTGSGRLLLEVALYRDSLSAPLRGCGATPP